jgi:hypothetical protein
MPSMLMRAAARGAETRGLMTWLSTTTVNGSASLCAHRVAATQQD